MSDISTQQANSMGQAEQDAALSFAQHATGALAFGFCTAVGLVLTEQSSSPFVHEMGRISAALGAAYTLWLASKAKRLYTQRSN